VPLLDTSVVCQKTRTADHSHVLAVFWDVMPCGSLKNQRARNSSSTLMMEGIRSFETRFLQEQHGVTSQKTAFFIAIAVKTSRELIGDSVAVM
jgi:hypothetical protein